jgi:hypothetical protein
MQSSLITIAIGQPSAGIRGHNRPSPMLRAKADPDQGSSVRGTFGTALSDVDNFSATPPKSRKVR